MPQFILKIDLPKKSLPTGFDFTNHLKHVVDAIDGYSLCELKARGKQNIRDINGNVVGHYEVIE